MKRNHTISGVKFGRNYKSIRTEGAGVFYRESIGKWAVRTKKGTRITTVGCYDTAEQAQKEYNKLGTVTITTANVIQAFTDLIHESDCRLKYFGNR